MIRSAVVDFATEHRSMIIVERRKHVEGRTHRTVCAGERRGIAGLHDAGQHFAQCIDLTFMSGDQLAGVESIAAQSNHLDRIVGRRPVHDQVDYDHRLFAKPGYGRGRDSFNARERHACFTAAVNLHHDGIVLDRRRHPFANLEFSVRCRRRRRGWRHWRGSGRREADCCFDDVVIRR